MFRREDTRPMNLQLAVRVAVVGAVALMLFSVILFRLWYLQVLSGDHYLAEANGNRVRELKVEAPRGRIVDRNGELLVGNRQARSVTIVRDRLPRDARGKAVLYKRLARALGVDRRRLRRRVNRQLRQVPFSSATAKTDVDTATVAYLEEHRRDFPGVAVEQAFERDYPRGPVGAHLVGYVGEVGGDALRRGTYPDAQAGDRVGIAGLEATYDRVLRGRNGATRLQVDALGNARGELSARAPVPGRQLRLTLDLAVQRAGQEALGTQTGAFVVMDVATGAVRALGSSPVYDPNVFGGGLTQAEAERLWSKANGEPFLNRAIQGAYPAGSTFKAITSVAALDSGLITPATTIADSGSVTVAGTTFNNAGKAAHGPVALRRALQVSSDVFYYLIGRDDNGRFAIQRWARRMGLGHRTGVDLPGEGEGLVPTARWRNRLFARKLTVDPWTVGHNVNLAVGQGDLLATPLQMAVAYAAVGNGGYVVTPHLADRVEDAAGVAIDDLPSPRRHRLPIRREWRSAILDGLHMAARRPGGTSFGVFAGFPIEVAGKTGTAQTCDGCPDQSWYVVLAPYPRPRHVVAVTVERGGFGAAAAAPAACRILRTLLNVRRRGACGGGSAVAGARG